MKAVLFLMSVLLSTQLYAQSWIENNNGIPDDDGILCLSSNDTHIFAGTWKNGVFISSDNGDSWHEANNGFNNSSPYIYIIKANNVNVLLGTLTALYYSSDNGDSWNIVDNNELKPGSTPMAIFINDNDVFYGENGAIYKSSDYGISWTLLASGGEYRHISSFAIDGENIFAGRLLDTKLLVSNDYGSSWNSIDSVPYPIQTMIFKDNNLIIGTDGGGLFISQNNGLDWMPPVSGLDNQYINSILSVDNNIFIGTSKGVYSSSDDGLNWVRFGSGIEEQYISSLTYHNNYLFAGTSYKGIFKIDLSTVSVDEFASDETISASPNPFSNSITIRYNLDAPDFVKIDVYNSLGNIITTLAYGFQNTGKHQAIFNADNLPAGMYYYIIQIGDRVESGKMMNLK